MVTTNVGGNPLITTVVSTNTLHPQYTKTVDEIQQEREEGENMWTLPPSMISLTVEDIAIAQGDMTAADFNTRNQSPFLQTQPSMRNQSLFHQTQPSFTSSMPSTSSTNISTAESLFTAPSSTYKDKKTNNSLGVRSERLTNFRSTLPDQRTSAATASVHLQPIIPADIHPQQLPSSQESLSGQVDAEKIVGDIINSCEDDCNDFYFDEYGKSLENTMAKTAPLERTRKPVAESSEFIMSIEEFAGTTRDKVFVPSQEESNLDIEEQVPGET